MSQYALYRFSAANQKFIHSFIGTARARTDQFSFAMASCLVNACQIKDEVDEERFDRDYRLGLLNKMNTLNEILSLDVDKVLYYSSALYNYRQACACFTGWTNVVHCEATAVADFFGISRYFSKDDLEVISKGAEQMNIDIRAITSLFEDVGLLNNPVA